METEQSISFLEIQINKSERIIHSLEQSNSELSTKANFLLNEKITLQELLDNQKSEIHSLKSQNIYLDSKLHHSSKKITELESQILDLAEKNKKGLTDLFSETKINEEETLKMMKERDFLKTECDELRTHLNIHKNLMANIEKTLENLKSNSLRKDQEFSEMQEKFEKDLKDFRIKINDLTLENCHLKQNYSNLNEELKKKEENLNNKEFEIKNLEFKIKEDGLNTFKNELELKCNLENSELKYKEKCSEVENLKDKLENLEAKSLEKEKFYEEKILVLEKDKQEIEQFLEEKKQENTKLYAQFQSGMKQRHNIETLRLPFELENEEKILQKTFDLQKENSFTKEQNLKYRNELGHIKEELKKKLPLLEIRKKEYDQMLDQYTNLKNKLEISLLSNSKLHEELKSQQKLIEEFKKDYSLSYKTIKDLSSQVSLLLFFSEKMRTKIHELSPYFDLSIYLDYKKPLEKINLDEQEQFYFLTIQDLQENNRNLLEKLNKIHLNEGFQINPIEFEELKHKNANIQLEIKQKQNLIDSLQEKIKKMQTLEDVKQLILGKNSEPFLNLEKKDLSNRNSLEKNSRIYDKHAKLIEENASLRKEEKRLKIDLKKLTFSHENLNNLNENLQDKIEQYIHSLNSLKETLSIKENEINSVIKEKNLIAETLTQRNNEIDALKLKVLELEKQCLFYDESKKSIEDLLNKALNEKMKYFDGFMSGQKEISSLMMRHKSELLFSREENQRILTEKQKNNEFFIQKSNEYKINQMKYKAKIENQELLLLQLNKKNQLNSQIISEQNQQILELNRKINIPINPFSFEEGVHSGFIHISQQKSYNLEDLKETLEHQKNSYESLIEKMTEKLMLLEQENLAYQDNVKNLESANEDLQEKLESTLQKIQEMEIEAENPQISNEEIELLNQEKANLKIENDELKKKLNDIVIEKDELKVTETQYLDKIKELTEENLILLQEIKDIKRKYEYQANVTHLKDILIKEQYELFKCQMKENSKQNEEKNKEIDSLLEKLQRKEEDEKEIDKMELEIEENVRELKEDDILLQLREKIGMLELKLQEKINEEFVFKTQANQYRTQLEVKVQEVLFGKQKEFNQNVEEIINTKESTILELMKDITELKKNLTVLQEEKMNLTEINEKISYQLKMKEIQIVLNQEELKKKSDENLEEGEIENPLKIEENLTENEIALIKEIIKDQKLVELLEKCKKILIYQSLETKI